MALVVDIKIPGVERQKKSSLTVDVDVHKAFRLVAFVEGRSKDLSGLMADMINCYIEQKHPDLIYSSAVVTRDGAYVTRKTK